MNPDTFTDLEGDAVQPTGAAGVGGVTIKRAPEVYHVMQVGVGSDTWPRKLHPDHRARGWWGYLFEWKSTAAKKTIADLLVDFGGIPLLWCPFGTPPYQDLDFDCWPKCSADLQCAKVAQLSGNSGWLNSMVELHRRTQKRIWSYIGGIIKPPPTVKDVDAYIENALTPFRTLAQRGVPVGTWFDAASWERGHIEKAVAHAYSYGDVGVESWPGRNSVFLPDARMRYWGDSIHLATYTGHPDYAPRSTIRGRIALAGLDRPMEEAVANLKAGYDVAVAWNGLYIAGKPQWTADRVVKEASE